MPRWISFALLVSLALAPAAAHAQQPFAGAPYGPQPLPVAYEPAPNAAQLPQPNAGPPLATNPPVPMAEAIGGLSLADLENMALTGNPSLAQAQSRIAAAQGRTRQAGLYPNPRVAYVGDEMGGGTAGFQGGSIMQEVVTGGKRRLDIAVASADVMAAQQEFAAQSRRVTSDVRIEFYNVLAAQRATGLAGEIMNVGEQGVKAAEQLYKAKQVALVDVLQSQVERDTASLALDTARNRHAAAWQRLAAVVGRRDLPPSPLLGDLAAGIPDIRWDEALQTLLSQSPEISAAVAQQDRANHALARAQREWIPNVDLELGVQHDNTGGFDVTNARVGVPLPIWNRNQGNIAAACAELGIAQAEISRVELSLQNRLANVYERYANAKVQHEKYARTIVPNAKTALELVTKGYQQGEFGYLQLLMAQRTYFQVNLDAIHALRELRESATLIEGQLLSESLGASMGDGKAMTPSTPTLGGGNGIGAGAGMMK